MLIKFNSPGKEQEHTAYFKACTALTNYIVDEMHNRDLVGLRICNTENVQDKAVGISLHRRDGLNLMWTGT